MSEKDKEEIFESAKVYVIDFHFSAKKKTDIALKKAQLDAYFDLLRYELQEEHNTSDDIKCDVFLRKH